MPMLAAASFRLNPARNFNLTSFAASGSSLASSSINRLIQFDQNFNRRIGPVVEMERFGLSEGAADSKSIGDDLTRAGNVFGTPAYMAPEQAHGEVECLDSRTDVFALGAMLCQLLTRKAPNRGDSVREILEKARAGDFEDAYAELDQCRVDSDLVKLTRWCLASDIEDRPADASVVAAAISRHLKLLHEKLELERLQRAEAEVRSREERKRRSLVLLVAGLVLTVVFGTTGTYWWYQKDLADRAMEAGFERRLIRSDVGNLIGQASLLREQGRWKTAAALIDNATRRLGENPPEDLLDDIQLAEVELKYAERMNKILFEGYSVGFGQVTNPDEMKAMFGRDGIHARAFRSYLSERFNLSPSIAELTGEQDLLRQFRESQILPLAITLLDDWAPDIEDSEFKADVLRLNSLLDQNETRTAIRQAVIDDDLMQILEIADLADQEQFEEEGKHYEFDVALCLAHLKRPDESFEAYTAGRKKYPNANLESYLGELFQQQQRYDYWYVTIADRVKLATENTPETIVLQYDLARAAVVIAVHHREDEQGGILWRQKAASAFQECLDAAGELLKSNESKDLDRSKVLAMLASVQARPDYLAHQCPVPRRITRRKFELMDRI